MIEAKQPSAAFAVRIHQKMLRLEGAIRNQDEADDFIATITALRPLLVTSEAQAECERQDTPS